MFRSENMLKKFRFMPIALTIVLCFSAIAFGQGSSGDISGTVTDQNGAVIPGATVTVENSSNTAGYKRTVTANDSGKYFLTNVPSGSYNITIEASGFAKQTLKGVTVVVDKSAVADLVLPPAGSTAEVDVTGADSAVTIDNADTKIDTNISKELFDALPKGTNFTSLLKIAPNVRPESRAGGLQIDGASGSENVFVIDGQEVTNFRTGVLNSNNDLPFEILQEVQVKSTGFEAEYGGATGGVINVVTAGGNNAWRGNFAISFEPSQLQGPRRTVLNAYDSTNVPGSFEQFQAPKDGGTNFFPVANFSGPIVKDKLWFSASYAPRITNTSRTIDYYGSSNPANRITPNESITYDQKLTQEYGFLRLDAQPSSKLRLFGTFLWNPLIIDGLLPGTTEGFSAPQSTLNIGGFRGADLLRTQGGRRNSNSFNGQATWNPLSNLVLNFRGGRNFLNETDTAYGVPSVTRVLCSQVSVVTSAQTGCAQGFQNVASNSGTAFDVSTRTTFDADASIVGVNAGGTHNFKFGYQYNRLYNSVERGYTNLGLIQLFYGRLISALAPVTPSGPICPAAPAPPTPNCVLGSGLMTRFGTVGEASSSNTGIYVQDSWRATDRLTFNLGIRFENEIVPSFGDSATTNAIKFGWGDKIAPRFGAAFDLTGDGKTKLFGSYGWFYDRFKYELPRGSFGGDFFRRDFFELTNARGVDYRSYTFANILGGAPDPIGGTCPIVGGPGYSVCQFDFRIATNIEGADIFETGAIDPNIKAARQSEYTIGLERQLGNNFVLAGRFTHKQQDRAIEDVGVFNDQGSEAYIIGNPGFGLVCEIAVTSGYPCPKANRNYNAVEVRIDKRATKYFFNGSYTWSRLEGNYSGLASADENGRNSPNVNRFFDLPPLGFNANGEPDDGPLPTDRPHVFKAYGGYFFNWGSNTNHRTAVTAFTSIQSGVPLTTIYNFYSLGTTILYGRGDLGRTEKFTETDLSISHRYKFGSDSRFTLEPYIDIQNLFDEANVLSIDNNISSTNFNHSQLTAGGCTTCTVLNPNMTVNNGASELASFDRLFNGGGIQQFVLNYLAAQDALPNRTAGTRASYGEPNVFQGPRTVRFGFRFFF